tara:strand:- start:6525 stop:8768 length:2244 start_codon:yes stop_codon:yes gene_type:complete
MARKSKKLVDNIVDLFRKANSSERQKWQTDAQKNYEFFLGDQLSATEKESLQAAGMPDFVINRITPVIEMMKFFATANNPRWQAVGAEGSDSDVAALHSDIADFCWSNSNGNSLYSSVIQDALVKGIGYMQVDVDPDQDRGMGEVVFNTINPFDVYVDPTSRDFLFRDASYIIVKKDMPKEQLMRLFPDDKRKIKNANPSNISNNDYSQRDITDSELIFNADVRSSSYTKDGEDDEILDYYEGYFKEKIAYMNLFVNMPPSPEEMQEIQKQVKDTLDNLRKEQIVQLEEQKLKLTQAVEQGEMIQERAILEIEKMQKSMEAELEQRKIVLLSQMEESRTRVENRVVTEFEYNIMKQDENLVTNIVDAVKFYENRIKMCVVVGDKLLYETILNVKEYPIIPFVYQHTGTPFALGAVSPLVGKQKELNKAHQIMIHNANLASNLRWMYEEGSVPEEEWEKYSSSPGALLKYRQGFAPPQPVQPLPLNSAFYGITENAKRDMEYTSGIYSSMQGDTGSSPETYRGLLAMDEYGTRRIKSWMQNIIEPSLEHLGKIFKDFAQSTYQAHKVFRIVNPNNIDEETQVEINVPIYNDLGNSIQKWNDYASSRFDVRIIGGSTLPLNRWALMEEYFKWYQSGLIDDIAMISETDIRNKESIIKRKSVYMQLRGQIEELQGLVTDREGAIETLERQLVQSGIQSKIQNADMKIQKDLLETEAAQSMLRNKLKSDTTTKIKELGLAVADAKKKATTK